MKPSRDTSRSGFTLLELLASVVVMGIISAVILPVLSSASESYIVTRDVRSRVERMSFALDRVARIIREAPIGEDGSGVGVRTATTTSLVFTDDTGFEFASGRLEMVVPGDTNALLCDAVDAVRIDYYEADGVTSAISTPERAHRIAVTLTSGELRMSVVAHPRVWIGQQEGGG